MACCGTDIDENAQDHAPFRRDDLQWDCEGRHEEALGEASRQQPEEKVQPEALGERPAKVHDRGQGDEDGHRVAAPDLVRDNPDDEGADELAEHVPHAEEGPLGDERVEGPAGVEFGAGSKVELYDQGVELVLVVVDMVASLAQGWSKTQFWLYAHFWKTHFMTINL